MRISKRIARGAGLAWLAVAAAYPAMAVAPKKPVAHAPAANPAAKAGPGDVTRAQMKAEVNKVFDMADTNHDGYMSRDEFGVRMGAVLNRTPPGSPGAPTREEAQRMLDAARAAFDAVDTNHDGKLSRAEASVRPLAAFDMMDANHDGILTLAEKKAARAQADTLRPMKMPAGPAQ